jgi:hypothetical protein
MPGGKSTVHNYAAFIVQQVSPFIYQYIVIYMSHTIPLSDILIIICNNRLQRGPSVPINIHRSHTVSCFVLFRTCCIVAQYIEIKQNLFFYNFFKIFSFRTDIFNNYTLQRVLTMVYNTHNYGFFRFCPTSTVLKN